jgi:SAM-dependent methyltransferase
MGEEVAREPQYDVFADEYLEHERSGFFDGYGDRPACLALLGDVAGKRVLDAGCGPGGYAAELVRRGAEVVGFDQSPRMVELSRGRVPGGEFRVHDFADPIDWLSEHAVDLALCTLAIEHVDDRVAALRELRRVLRPAGALVISLQHPISNWLHNGGSYFDTRVVRETWGAGWSVRYWIAPLQTRCAEFYQAGFLIEQLVEPRPADDAAPIDPERYEELTPRPEFIVFRLRPDASPAG